MSILFFLASIIIIALVIIVAVFWQKKGPNETVIGKMKSYFKAPEGKEVLKGILMFCIAGAVFATIPRSCEAKEAWHEHLEYFEWAEVYMGMDHTISVSPQCRAGLLNNKLTSNGGIRVNIMRSKDKNWNLNYKYTHHSCALNPDRNSYDTNWGIETTYRFWGS